MKKCGIQIPKKYSDEKRDFRKKCNNEKNVESNTISIVHCNSQWAMRFFYLKECCSCVSHLPTIIFLKLWVISISPGVVNELVEGDSEVLVFVHLLEDVLSHAGHLLLTLSGVVFFRGVFGFIHFVQLRTRENQCHISYNSREDLEQKQICMEKMNGLLTNKDSINFFFRHLFKSATSHEINKSKFIC